ncbi:hypothetical protein GF366_04310, partial [Candidatus Peregrinibacteria bacterium]|nr:hypothetical protein [Candidatus Peregrinibacteria bacterium]
IPGEEEPVSPPDGVTGPMFYDIADHWAREEIEAMGEVNVVEGDPDGGFRPDDGLNRAEAAALLYRILGLGTPEAPTEKPFSDVEVDAWYAGYVNELKDMELLFGNPDGTYEPGENINRAEFLSMAMNVYYYISDADTQSAIDDLMEGPMTDMYEDLLENQWYTSEVTAATEMGFVHGSVCNDGRCFYAGNEVTRAEATVMLYNMFYDYLT